jgi:hypothetical protein
MVTFYAGQKVTAAQLEALVDYTTRIEKAADETVSASTTMQDDNEIVFTGLTSGSTYELTGTLIYTGATTGGIKCQWTWPSGGGGYFSYGASSLYETWADSAGNRDFECYGGSKNTASPSDVVSGGATTPTPRAMQWHGRLVLAASGTLTLQWAQFFASGSTIVKAGTWFSLKKVS